MASADTNNRLVDIKTSLDSNRQLKNSVIQVACDFIEIRDAYIKQLPAFTFDAERKETVNDRLQRISYKSIQQREIPLGLIVFGPNSSGKSSFIQHFLEIGDILPSGVGPVTARITKMTYAPAEQARALVYNSLQASLECNHTSTEVDLRSYFLEPEPQWIEISKALSKHLNRAENSDTDLEEWAKTFIEIRLPSPTLKMGIDMYDTPGFLSGNRESVLINNLYDLAKTVRPTLLFLYENPSVVETDMACFMGMKQAIGSLDRIPIFFLNTKADVALILKDSRVNQCNVSLARFQQSLHETRQKRYDLLREQTALANELLGSLPVDVDECLCFGICSIPKGRTLRRELTDHMNKETFSRIISFAVQTGSEYVQELVNDILLATEDFFDLALSASYRDAEHFQKLREDALEWGNLFFAQFKIDLPKLAEYLHKTIVELFEEKKKSIADRAARLVRDDDPLAIHLPTNSKNVRDFIHVAVEEEIMKVAVNKTLSSLCTQVKTTLEVHFDNQMRRRNELLRLAQRFVLPEISPSILTKQRLLSKFMEGLIKLPMQIGRFFRSLPTLPYIEYYNTVTHNQVTSEDDPIYKLLDCLDLYANLSNESKRLAFAEQFLNVLLKDVLKRKYDFQENLTDWMEQQRKAFKVSVLKNYNNIIRNLDKQHVLHELNTQYYGKFARIECKLLAAKQLFEFNGIPPTIKDETTLGEGAFFSIHSAEWGDEKNLVVKKLIRPLSAHPYMAYLDAHYHRVISSLKIRNVVPLMYLYEHELENGEHVLWIILPRYSRSLRDYLYKNIQTITLDSVLNFAINIAETLVALHQNEKQLNILLKRNN
ncbi:unnamed protein product [Rotaria sp. Silwood2]|nr:unnamed protein product [Rotaria sp. Silwood2]CAF4373962.1 unnamed protein product [Rotaria sp. Silwood2]